MTIKSLFLVLFIVGICAIVLGVVLKLQSNNFGDYIILIGLICKAISIVGFVALIYKKL